ncbi:MAG: NADH-ubiquinone oxidoreductase-F iron-sulfur binding region domain-containing protein [Pseudomonadota bacterium]
MTQILHSAVGTAYEERRRDAESRLADLAASAVPTIHIGTATCGIAAGALETRAAFEAALAERGLTARIHTVGCNGHCYAEPVVIIDHPASGFPPIFYPEVTAGKARMLTKLFIEEGDPRLEHILGAMEENDLIPPVSVFPRFSGETRVIMDLCGRIDPGSLDEYLAADGYASLATAIDAPAETILENIRTAGLRGRGGAGFPTGDKWAAALAAPFAEKIVICNADEGDPGAYMDRTLLESNPHQIIEGLAICARVVGAQRATIYVRAEYPLAVSTVTRAIAQAEASNLLGENILGSGMSLFIDVFQGSGAFVCGEETALIRSMEGFRGMPVPRPPYPAACGLHRRPTVINNVKTLAAVPGIVRDGGATFRATGTATSPGTAIFSVVGSVVHPGLVEIPMGTTLRHLIFDVCGGIANKKRFKTVQIGGPSGGCLPEAFLDTPIDFDSLTEAGAMMGSGGMVVMDEDTCPVEMARYFLDFTQKESCGKCTFCRIGTFHMLTILERLTRGEAIAEDLDRLEALSRDVGQGSLCALGRTAPNPVITALTYFREEFEAHVHEGRCPGRACRPLTAFYIDLEKCARGCDACVGCCPVEAVFTTSTRKKGIDQTLCVKCGECMVACPPEYDAVRKVSPPSLAPVVPRPEEKKSTEGAQ